MWVCCKLKFQINLFSWPNIFCGNFDYLNLNLNQSIAMKIQLPSNSASISTNTEVDKVYTWDASRYYCISVWTILCSWFKILFIWQIKFGEEGWKNRYYAEKFEAKTEDDREKVRRDVVREAGYGLFTLRC